MHLGPILLGPHGGHMYHLYNFESSTPKDDHWQVLLKSDHGCIFKMRIWLFFIRTPSPNYSLSQGPKGAILGTVMNNFYSPHIKVSAHSIIWLYYTYNVDREWKMFEIYIVLTLGSPPLRPPWGPHITIWTTLNPLPLRMISSKFGWVMISTFEEDDENLTFFPLGPPPKTVDPHRALTEPSWELSWTTFILHI